MRKLPLPSPVLALTVLALSSACTAPLRRFEASRSKMGTSFRVVLYASSAELAEEAIDAAYARVDQLNAALSDYEADSELSRLSAASDAGAVEGLHVSEELATVLAAARHWAEVTDGAFDPTLGPLVRLWRRSARQGELPSEERLEQARGAVGWRALEVDRERLLVSLREREMRLDLGGIAKGYTLDECVRVLAEHGCGRALVDGGGDVVVGDAPPGEQGWRVAVRPFGPDGEPLVLELVHAAVATSGDAYRYVEIDGLRYSHVLDPATGLGLVRRVAATVVARDGMTADALATAACVMGSERAVDWLGELEGIEGRVVEVEGDESVAEETRGFAARVADRTAH